MRPRIILLFISIIAIGGIVLPQTVSLFAGQHYWYDLSGNGSDVPCEKCHADVAEEMNQIHGPHTGETGYGRFECEYCHRIFPIGASSYADGIEQNASYQSYRYTYASVSGIQYEPGKEAHAASTVPCMYCHSGSDVGMVPAHDSVSSNCSECHSPVHGFSSSDDDSANDCIKCHDDPANYIAPAGGFSLTTHPEDTGTLAAHKKFVDKSMNNSLMEDANEACIACHTHIAVKFNFSHTRSLEFKAGQGYPVTTNHGTHNWTVTEWTANGTAYATTWGNTSGNSTTTYGEVEWPGNIGDIYS